MESRRRDSMKGGEQFHVSKDQCWREPDVLKLWRDHLVHMKRQQMPENYSPSITEESDVEWDDVDDEYQERQKNEEVNDEKIGKSPPVSYKISFY